MMLLELESQTVRAKIAPLPDAFLRRVREEGRDDLGQPVRRLRAKGGEPCRDALRRAKPGEEIILASFSPFTVAGPFHEFGPVYVFANEVPRHEDEELPVGGADDYLREQFVIRAYSKEEDILDAALVQAPAAQAKIDALLGRADVAFLHVRFPTYGCFACRIDR